MPNHEGFGSETNNFEDGTLTMRWDALCAHIGSDDDDDIPVTFATNEKEAIAFKADAVFIISCASKM